MVTVGRVNWILPRYNLSHINRSSRPWHCVHAGGIRNLSRTIAILTVAGCGALSILPLTQFRSQRSLLRRYHGTNDNVSPFWSRHPTRWTDVLPSDLDVLDDSHLIGTVGAQILRFAGWTKRGTTWIKPQAVTSLTLQDRLERITPTWKAGGTVDYSIDGTGIFSEALVTGTTIEQLGHTMESMGLLPKELDFASQQALRTMLSWSIPDDSSSNDSNFRRSNNNNNNQHLVLLVFSFDATPLCWDVSNCPQPGPSNELLAATVLQFLRRNETNQASKIHVITQWEVAAALKQQYSARQKFNIIPVGTPGVFQNTADIFDLMLCELNLLISGKQLDSNLLNAILLAHPDHLRRVFFTAQTILRSKQSSCTVPQLPITTALLPYDLMWPIAPETMIRSRNLFQDVPLTSVNSMGMKIATNWYDKQHLGYFIDGDPQFWTHNRDVWIMYDQWAVLKGIVTGTIQPVEMPKDES